MIIQLLTWLIESPVAWQSCFFSSSEGYGWSLCLCSQSLRKSVTGLGSFPRLRCGGRSTREGLEDGTAWGERLGELVTLMDGFAPALAARPEAEVEGLMLNSGAPEGKDQSLSVLIPFPLAGLRREMGERSAWPEMRVTPPNMD